MMLDLDHDPLPVDASSGMMLRHPRQHLFEEVHVMPSAL
jgi:hypothetical protein